MHRTGVVGWLGLTAYVVAWDRFASDTLSSAFGRALVHRQARWPTIGAWIVVTGHLFGVLPKRVDPIHQLGRVVIRKA